MTTEALKEKYRKAKEYEEIILTSGYQSLKKDKLSFVQRVERAKTQNGLKPNYQLDEDLIEAKTYLRLFDELEITASKKELWAKQLEAVGVVL